MKVLEQVFFMNPLILPCSVVWPTVAQGFPLFGFLNLIYRNMARLIRWGISPSELIYLHRKILNQMSPCWKAVLTSDGMGTKLSGLPFHSKVLVCYGDPVSSGVFTIQ